VAFGSVAAFNVEVVAELARQPSLRAVTEQVIREASRRRCVVLGRGGFVVLADHPGAIHIRLHAPLDWRATRCAREQCISRERARELLVAEDRARDTYLRRLYHRHFSDLAGFHLVLDASRFSTETVVEIALAAGDICSAGSRSLAAAPGAPAPGQTAR